MIVNGLILPTTLEGMPAEGPAWQPLPPGMRESERQIVVTLVTTLLAAGYSLSVYDGVEFTIKRSRKAAAIFAGMYQTDENQLFLHGHGAGIGRTGRTWIRLIYGNGSDLISDYTVDIPGELFMATNALSEKRFS